MGTFPPNKVKHYLVPVGIKTIIRDNNGNVKDIITENIPSSSTTSTPVPNNSVANQIFELLTNWKISYNLYREFVEDVDNNIIQINCWSDSTKIKKLFTKDITYVNGNVTYTTIKDEVTNKILTTTPEYSGDDIISVTNTII